MAYDPSPSPLVGGLQTLRERWWLVVLAMVVGLIVSLVVSVSSTKQYEGKSSLVIRKSQLGALINPSATQSTEDPARTAATNLLLVKSTAVASRVRDVLGTHESLSDLIDQVDATSNPDADIIDITATDPNPKRAATLANAFADQAVAFEQVQARQDAMAGAQRLRSELGTLPRGATAERAQLEQALQNVLALRAITLGDATVVDRATPATSPSSPNYLRAALLGLLGGLVVGIAAVFVTDLFDRRLKSTDALEDAYGLAAIGSIPWMPRTLESSAEALEPFRILRSSLNLLSVDSPPRTVVVTSAVAQEGKTTAAVGLARAAALAAQSVVLVEADLRRPTFQRHFDVGQDPGGLTTALMEGVPIEELLRTPLDDLPNLRVLPAGPSTATPSELLVTKKMELVLAQLSGEADLVVIDTPPLLPVADAHALLPQPAIDACLVVGRTYYTTRDQARRCRRVLERHRIASVALVVVGAEGTQDYDYSYAAPAVNGRGATRGAARQRSGDGTGSWQSISPPPG